ADDQAPVVAGEPELRPADAEFDRHPQPAAGGVPLVQPAAEVDGRDGRAARREHDAERADALARQGAGVARRRVVQADRLGPRGAPATIPPSSEGALLDPAASATISIAVGSRPPGCSRARSWQGPQRSPVQASAPGGPTAPQAQATTASVRPPRVSKHARSGWT